MTILIIIRRFYFLYFHYTQYFSKSKFKIYPQTPIYFFYFNQDRGGGGGNHEKSTKMPSKNNLLNCSTPYYSKEKKKDDVPIDKTTFR